MLSELSIKEFITLGPDQTSWFGSSTFFSIGCLSIFFL